MAVYVKRGVTLAIHGAEVYFAQGEHNLEDPATIEALITVGAVDPVAVKVPEPPPLETLEPIATSEDADEKPKRGRR